MDSSHYEGLSAADLTPPPREGVPALEWAQEDMAALWATARATDRAEALTAAVACLQAHTEREPAITSALQGTLGAGDRLAGLEFRMKSPASLARKIHADQIEAAQYGGRSAAADVAAEVNDVLRYTVETPEHDGIPEATERTVKGLHATGMHVETIKNKYAQGAPYKGIHLIVGSSPAGVRFEVQVHSALSLAAKIKSHVPYETARDVHAEPKERKAADAECRALFADVPTPRGLDSMTTVDGVPVRK
ncbi:MAG: hypothetical protein LBE25_09300 [Arthrobacter sp.]|jgi:hypothetical protein|nr:hypothetical protein [Arthrobacter sp.]